MGIKALKTKGIKILKTMDIKALKTRSVIPYRNNRNKRNKQYHN